MRHVRLRRTMSIHGRVACKERGEWRDYSRGPWTHGRCRLLAATGCTRQQREGGKALEVLSNALGLNILDVVLVETGTTPQEAQ